MATYGNTGVSSLLSASKAAYDKVQTYNDNIAAYEWDNSARTAEDYAKYNDYLTKRGKVVTDPSKALTLQKTATSAYRSFNSAEISRATDAVNLGNISNRDKYQVLVNLYSKAVANGDDYLAQSIAQRADSLSMTIQNQEQAAASRASSAGSSSYAKSFEAYLKDNVDGGIKELEGALARGEINLNSYYDRKNQLLEQKQGLYQQAIDSGALSEAKAVSYQDKLDAVANDTKALKESGYLGQAAQQNPSRLLNYDTNSGTYSVSDRAIIGHKEDGTPIYQEHGVAGKNLVRKSLTKGQVAGDQAQVNAVDGLAPLPGFENSHLYTVDPRTGQTLYYNKAQKTHSTTNPTEEVTYNSKSGKYNIAKGTTAPAGGFDSHIASIGRRLLPAAASSSLNPFATPYNAVSGIINFAKANSDKRAEQQRLSQAQADIAAKNAASAAALAAIPRSNPAVPVKFVPSTGKVVGAPSVYRAPAATVAATNTPGTKEFTKKYLLGSL